MSTHSPKHGHQHTAKQGHEHAHGHEPEHQHDHEHDHDDDLIVVPKGQSRGRFYAMLGLLVFTLIAYVVPGALMDSLAGSGDAGEAVYVSWQLPGGERREISGSDFLLMKRDLNTLDDTSLYGDTGNLAALGLRGFDPKEDLNAARFLILEDLAKAQGIRVTAEELASRIGYLFGSIETYRMVLQSRSAYLTPSQFEQSLRKALLVRRFLDFVSASAATSDPAKVVERWKAEHQEYAFDYVQVAAVDSEEEARAALPADAELEAWFAALPESDKTKHKTPARWSAEFAYVPLAGDAAATATYDALLARYPRPAEKDAAQQAQSYYDANKFFRFKRPEPLETAEDPTDKLYFPFAEVEQDALREAPIYDALMAWHADLAGRIAAGGESPETPVDFAAEAAELGLSFSAASEPKSQPDWLAAEMPWGGTESRVPARMANLADGQIVPSVLVDQRAMVVGRMVQKLAPAVPPFAEIREAVVADWVTDKRSTLAVEKLESVRDLLGERPAAPAEGEVPPPFEPVATAERFAEVAREKGFELLRRDYAQRRSMVQVEEGALPIEAFLSTHPIHFSVAEGTVTAATADRAREHAFLIRYGGQRDPDVSQMKPAELEQVRRTMEGEAVRDFFRKTFDSREFLEERYGLVLHDARPESAPENPTE